MGAPDWMPFDPEAFVTGTARMTTEEVGAYMLLLSYQWIEGGTLEEDMDELAALTRLPRDRFDRAWKRVGKKFGDAGEGRIANERLTSTYEKAVERLEAARESGSKGGRASAQKRKGPSSDPSSDPPRDPQARTCTCQCPSLSQLEEKGVELPNALDTCAFHEKWEEWLVYRRRDRRKSVSKAAAERQLQTLARVGVQAAIETIDNSIRNDWQGLFPDKVKAPDKPVDWSQEEGEEWTQ